MGKKRKQQTTNQTATAVKEEKLTLADQLGGDLLAKLKATKQGLLAEQQAKEEELQAKLAFEKKQREKNKSFEQLLNEYGTQGSKY